MNAFWHKNACILHQMSLFLADACILALALECQIQRFGVV
jgi:hypothetical protein